MIWGNIRGTFCTYGGLFKIRTQWFEFVPVFGKFELSPFEIKSRTYAFELITVPSKIGYLTLPYLKWSQIVPSPILTQAMAVNNSRPKLNWVSSETFKRRKIHTKNKISHAIHLVVGVPQGSVLRPFLFMLFRNDSPSIFLESIPQLPVHDLKVLSFRWIFKTIYRDFECGISLLEWLLIWKKNEMLGHWRSTDCVDKMVTSHLA